MKEVTKHLVKDFKVLKLNTDFMGYSLQKKDIPTFHHLLIANRNGGPYSYENGVILFTTPHQYLHVIEAYDYHKFALITSEMYDMKVKKYLAEENLENIGEILSEFEYKHQDTRTRKGRKLIRDEYLHRKYK